MNNTNNYNDIGFNKGSAGTVTVDGAGSKWTIVDGVNSGYRGLVIGSYGNGTLAITNGGQVNSSNSGYIAERSGTGTVTVDGAGSTWNNGFEISIGYSGAGTLNITNGGIVNSSINGANGGCSIGNNPGSSGVVTVDGPASQWNNNGFVQIGNGTLNITDGGTVTMAGATSVATGSGAGVVNFGPNGGTLTTLGLYGPHSQITGTGTINARGVYYDGGLVFDSTHTAVQTQHWQGPQQDVTFNLDLSGLNGTAGDLAVGYQTAGTLTIRDGVAVTTGYGYLAYGQGTTGTAIIDGPGSTWNYNDSMYVGLSGTGTLQIMNGGTVNGTARFGNIFIGSSSTSSGTISVDGAGSNWTVSDLSRLYVGYAAAGTLNITNGGSLNLQSTESNSDCYIAYNGGPGGSGGPGNVNVNGVGSTLNFTDSNGLATPSFSVGFSGSGTLQITNGGKVICGNNNISYVGNNGSGAATVDGAGSSWISGKQLIVGNYGSGIVNITDGGHVSSGLSYVSYTSSQFGNVSVDGIGSSWNSGSQLYIGYEGPAVVRITNGGNVTSATSYINLNTSYPAIVAVDGAGSSWNAGNLNIGYWTAGWTTGPGMLTIDNGGSVTATGLTIGNSTPILAIDAGDGSTLNIGTGSIANSGIIRIRAARSAVAGKAYSPIAAGGWTGSGSVQAFGGTWNATTRQFIASGLASGVSGSPVTIDSNVTQRLAIADPTTNKTVFASFLATTTSSNLTLTATGLTDVQKSLLKSSLASGTSLLAGWTFATTGYAPGTPVFLSIDLVPRVTAGTLGLWQFNGTTWSAYTAPDLTYDGADANFTVTGLDGYAVSGVLLPLPGDANSDGAIDLSDLSIVLNKFGTTTSLWSDGNFDGASTIDLTDLSDVLNNFGQTNPNASTANTVTSASPAPEPSSLLLLGFTSALVVYGRASRQKRNAFSRPPVF